ncbi:MAG: ribbon-helix-helix protein, CopG family [Thermoanaerobaculia bacterium]
MSERLQVILDEKEMRDLRRLARQEGVTVSEWVRRCLRDGRRAAAVGDPGRKLAALRSAVAHELPSGEIEAILDPTARRALSGVEL